MKQVPYNLRLAQMIFDGDIRGRVGVRVVSIGGHSRLEKYIEVSEELINRLPKF